MDKYLVLNLDIILNDKTQEKRVTPQKVFAILAKPGGEYRLETAITPMFTRYLVTNNTHTDTHNLGE